MHCTRHGRLACLHSECRRERDRRNAVEDSSGGLSDPTSAVHQAVYGGGYFGSAGDSSSSCDMSDSGSSYSSDSSTSSYDSGSSSSSDCGGY